MARAGIGDRVEGTHAVSAAVAAGRVTKLMVDAARSDPEITALIAAAEANGAEVELVADIASLALTDAPQGVVAHAEPITPVDLATAVATTDPAALVVLDHLEDPRNVGAVARSAVAAGIRALVVPSRRAAPLGATAFKAAAGAFEHLSIAMVSSVADTVAKLRDLGVWVVGLDAGGERS
ncbi:MAG: 23S rRNA (guanosine(2251)-2'-O)-methyltransferase RlmB, partial [Acidimicrobiia bacterium]|nr:23S rRNA (guanosine(2251)-2'-O)-methyltransferase RlmB [Acidimicrobiia bacterium]